MKKEEVNGLIAYSLIIILALVFGFTVLRNYASSSQLGNLYYLYVLGAVIAGLLFNAILFEIAHIIGAKLGRYSILSVNILGFCFKNENGKLKFKFSSFDGLTGETKILPKEGNKKSNPTPYLLMGSLFYIVEAVVGFVLFSYLGALGKNEVIYSNVGYFILTMVIIGAMIFFYNILPIRLDSITDGYRLRMATNEKNKDAFNELLRVENAIANGNPNVEIKTFTGITSFTADLNLNKVYLLLDQKKYKEAEELIDIILQGANELPRKTYLRAKAQKIYINIMNRPLEEAKTYYDEQVPLSERKEMSEDTSMVCIRTYLLMAGLLDRSRSESIIALNRVYTAYRRTEKNRRPIERTLFNEALDKVNEAHPDWELLDYKIQEEKK